MLRYHPIRALHEVVGAAQHIGAQAHLLGARAPWGLIRPRHAARRMPSIAHVVVAGAAVLAFVALLTWAEKPGRSRPSKLALGALLILVGAVVLSLRRSGRRYRR